MPTPPPPDGLSSPPQPDHRNADNIAATNRDTLITLSPLFNGFSGVAPYLTAKDGERRGAGKRTAYGKKKIPIRPARNIYLVMIGAIPRQA